jgi:hypothetical protein
MHPPRGMIHSHHECLIPHDRIFITRLLSAWFYRCHTPNNDCFQVRPEFKEIAAGQRPKVTFEEYIEMPEYQNIQSRMLGADSFPYKNITITKEVIEAHLTQAHHY